MFIFWDNSNIHISGLKAMEQKEPGKLKELFRTNFKNLFELVRNNRLICLEVFRRQTMHFGII